MGNIIELNKEEWDEIGREVKVNKFLSNLFEAHGETYNKDYPVILFNVLYNMGVSIKQADFGRDNYEAQLIINDERKVLYIDSILFGNKNRAYEIVAYVIKFVSDLENISKKMAEEITPEAFRNIYEQIDEMLPRNSLPKYKEVINKKGICKKKLLTQREKKQIRKEVIEKKTQEFIEFQFNPENKIIGDVEYLFEKNFIKHKIESENQFEKSEALFAVQLAKKDSGYEKFSFKNNLYF